ncbi:hypothetical protein [Paenibacillus arenilitoris]|uniref:Uncharacterized protein n=1 Tax=Paenibacillus arenilitoris TaxID=2772299 RepID=A0A927H360_9BACL|nr:hypothetical protein [Paenibacillus arenilitoris]MBD2866971.1 hypothetical protein [Paenibacillus arenilitoris]
MTQKNKRLLPNRMAIVICAFVLAAGLAIVGFVSSGESAEGPDEAIVVTVNGDPVTAVEFSRLLRKQRAAVIDDFKRTYGAEPDKGFWHTEFNGEVPADTAKQRALSEAVKLKLQLNLSKSYGIIQGTSYSDLLAEMEKENARRSAALHAGRPVYGPIRFDEHTFIDWYISKVLIELKEKLFSDAIAVTDKQLREHYEMIKDDWFRLEDSVRFHEISVSYTRDGLQSDRVKQKQAKERMEAVKQLLERGKTAEEAVNQLQSETGELELVFTEEHFNNDSARKYFKSQPELYEWLADPANADRVSAVIDNPAAGRYVLAKIVGRESGGYSSYEEQVRQVRNHYTDVKFDEYLNKLIDEAEVRVEDRYYKLSME